MSDDLYEQRIAAMPLTKLNLRTTARWERCRQNGGHRYRRGHVVWRDAIQMHVCTRCKVPAEVKRSKNDLPRHHRKLRAKRWNGPITPAHKPARAA